MFLIGSSWKFGARGTVSAFLLELFQETWHWKTQVQSTCPRSIQGHSKLENTSFAPVVFKDTLII